MSYRLVLDETIPDGIRRIATEQADKALSSLTDADVSVDERVHDARKCFKKIRAVLRLVRDEIGEDVYQRENVSFRDAGRQLADMRERAVTVATLDRIGEHFSEQLAEQALASVRSRLVADYAAAREEFSQSDRLQQVAEMVRAARQRIAQWPIEQHDFEALRPGLQRVYKRGCKGLRAAYVRPSAENYHAWRKRVKYLWYHLRVLRNGWPDVLDGWVGATHDLAGYLGDDHDLAELRGRLLTDPVLVDDAARHQALIGLIDRWRIRLQNDAFPLAQRIYVDKPKDFTRRMAIFWQAGQVAGELCPAQEPATLPDRI